MLEQKRLGNHGTGTGSEQASQGSDEMGEKDDLIAHHRIPAGREIPANMGAITIRQPQVWPLARKDAQFPLANESGEEQFPGWRARSVWH